MSTLIQILERIAPHDIVTWALVLFFIIKTAVDFTQHSSDVRKVEAETAKLVHETYQETIKGLQEDLKALQERLDGADAKLNIEQGRNEGLVREIIELRRGINDATCEIASLRTTAQHQADTIKRQQERILDLEKRLAEVEAERNMWRDRAIELGAENNSRSTR